jgi:hypothetical protein
MKNVFNHLKTSSIMSGSGLVSFAGMQYISTNLADNFFRTLMLFLFTTAMGVTSKLVLERFAVKKELDK